MGIAAFANARSASKKSSEAGVAVARTPCAGALRRDRQLASALRIRIGRGAVAVSENAARLIAGATVAVGVQPGRWKWGAFRGVDGRGGVVDAVCRSHRGAQRLGERIWQSRGRGSSAQPLLMRGVQGWAASGGNRRSGSPAILTRRAFAAGAYGWGYTVDSGGGGYTGVSVSVQSERPRPITPLALWKNPPYIFFRRS